MQPDTAACSGSCGGRYPERGLVQQDLGEFAVVVIEHAGQGLDEVVVLGFHPGAGQGGQFVRVAFPGDHGLDHVLG